MTQTSDHYRDRDLPDPKCIRKKLAEAQKKFSLLPEKDDSFKEERRRLGFLINSLRESLSDIKTD